MTNPYPEQDPSRPGTPERVVGLSPQILPNAATKGEQVCCECPDI